MIWGRLGIDEDVARLVQVKVDQAARVHLPERDHEPVEEIGGQRRPLAETLALNVLVDVRVRVEAGQDLGDFRYPLAAPQVADFAMRQEAAQQAEREKAEVHPPVDLADETGWKFEV
jgi:hypothetical protein